MPSRVALMAVLHYGPHLRVQIDDETVKQTTDAIGQHATRGGWVTITDVAGQEWSLLITAGVPIWVGPEQAGSGAAPG